MRGATTVAQAKRISAAIDKKILQEKRELQRENCAKLLLLGASESGKTTFLKQIKIIHGQGLGKERLFYRRVVRLNVIDAIRQLCSALQSHGLYLSSPFNQEHLIHMESLFSTSMGPTSTYFDQHSDDQEMFYEAAPRIKALWQDPTIREIYKHQLAEGLQDSAFYFLDDIDRIAHRQYMPTDQDILMARFATTGITEHKFLINRTVFRIFDVGGLRSQRQYWAPYFDDCAAIVFIVAISSFDQMLSEDNQVNRMLDSLQLFRSICNHPLFVKTSIILFLNKTDVLERKLQLGIRVSQHWKGYSGPNDMTSVTKYFKGLFFAESKVADKDIYVHFTQATDTTHMRSIVGAVTMIVQRANLKSSGLLL